jgi:Protein of unknown function (DUF4239)
MFLTTMPLWLSGIILVGMTTLVAMSGPALIRRRIHLDRLRVNNEVAGFKFATVGVLYAVLLAFAVIVVWEKFAEAERTVAKEAGAVATLYRLSGGLDEETGSVFRQNLTDYSRAVINEDWPAMEQGRDSAHVREALDRAYATILGLRPTEQRGAAIFNRCYASSTWSRKRAATGLSRPPAPFRACFGSCCLPALSSRSASRSFFGTQNVVVQTLMTGMLSLLIFAAFRDRCHRSPLRRVGEGAAGSAAFRA